MKPNDPDYDFGIDPIHTTSEKVKKLLALAYERLDPADKVLAAFKPGIMCHTNGDEVSFILEATGEVIAIADRSWLTDLTTTAFIPSGSLLTSWTPASSPTSRLPVAPNAARTAEGATSLAQSQILSYAKEARSSGP